MTKPNHLILHTGIAALAVVAAIFLGTIPTAHAVPGDGASSNIRLLDTNANGKIDRITFDIENAGGDTWALTGAAPHALSVTDDGNDVTIGTVSIPGSATANPVTVQVDLDENDADLDVDTSASAVELIYTQETGDQTCTVCIQNGVDAELNAINTGDTDVVDTELDFAAPQVKTLTYGDADADGKIDLLTLVFSETLNAAVSELAPDDITVTAGDFIGLSIGTDTGDLLTADNTTYTLDFNSILGASEATVRDTNSDNAGEDFTLSFSGFTFSDGSNAYTTNHSIPLTNILDGAAPFPTVAAYYDSDSDGTVNRVLIGFSEPTTLTMEEGDWSFTTSGDISLAGDFATGECSASGPINYICTAAGGAAVPFSADANETGLAVFGAGLQPVWTYVNTDGDNSITDGTNHTTGFSVTVIDQALPRVRTATTSDSDNNGKVDRIDIQFTEDMNNVGSGDVTVAGQTVTGITEPSAGLVRVAIQEGSNYNTDLTPSITVVGGAMSDTYSPTNTVVEQTPTVVDGAAPILVSASPTDGGTLIPATANFTLTFSEDLLDASVISSNITGSADVGTATFDVTETSAGVVTADPTGASFSPSTTVMITINGDSGGLRDTASNLFNNAGTAIELEVVGNDGRYTFSTLNPSSGGGGGGGSPSTVPVTADAVVVTSPNGGEALTGGASHTVAWTSTGNVNNVNLSYSLDGGATYTSIVAGTDNDGSYAWSVPNIAAASVTLRVVGRDSGGATLATDLSDAAFSIEQDVALPASSQPAASSSPVSMRTQAGSLVEMATGVLFRGVALPDVYRVDADGTRHVFPNETTFFSWGYSFDQVVVVNDDQLRLLSLGARVTMKPGSYLVKIQSDPKVYEVGEGATLTHVPDEATAVLRFGANWATTVRDIPVVFFGDYRIVD